MKRAIRRPIKTNQPAPVNSKKQSSATRVPSTPAHQSATGTDRWKACRLVDERTGNTFIGIDFPNNLGDYSFEIIESDLAASSAKVRDRLKSRGATLGGTKNDQITFISQILENMEPTLLFLAMKPGFRGNGFILGEGVFGTAKGRYRSRRGYDSQGPGKIGDRSGTREAWNRDVGAVATNSSYLMFAISLGLASCLPGYFREKTKNGSELGPLITETAVFNFSGQSTTGRTTLSLAALGLFAPPGLIAKWDFTRRGLEELAESYNDLLFVLDDTEKHVDGSTNFKTALRWVNQIIPSGKSKFVSETTMMPSLTWSTFGLTSSPKALNQIAAEVHWNCSEGELVRWIDIPVPPRDQGGIFDRIHGDEQKRTLHAAELIKTLERGVAQNYGGIFPLWIRYLLDEDRSKELKHFVDVFVRKMAPHGDSWDQRLATKFGVVFAAGVMAVDASILPWTRKELGPALSRCYLRAIEAMNAEANAAQKFLKVIGGRLDTPEYFPRASGTATAVDLDEPVIGLRALYKGANVVAIRDDTLIRQAGSSSAANSVLELLKSKCLIRGGHGHAGTTQLPVTIRIGEIVIQKPRFWLIDIVRAYCQRLFGLGT